MEDAETARRAAPFRFAGMERKKKKQLAGRRTEERIRRKTITVHPLKSSSSPVNRTPCTRCFFSIEITMRWLTSKNHCVYSVRTNEERERRETKKEKRKMIRQREEGIWTRERKGRGFEKLNWTLTKEGTLARDNELLRTPRCLQMVAVARRYWFFSAVFHPYRAISNRERQAQNRP